MAGCGCGGSGGFNDGFVPAENIQDPSYFSTRTEADSMPSPADLITEVLAPTTGARKWNPATGTEE